MKKVSIGVDISMKTLDISVCLIQTRQIINSFQVANTLKGIELLIQKVRRIYSSDDLIICFEHTGNYGLLLAYFLDKNQLRYSAVPAVEIKYSQGMTRGKTDSIDAKRIAIYAAINAHKLRPSKLPGQHLMKIKHLLTHRSLLVRTSSSFKNHLKSLQVSKQVVELDDVIGNTKEQLFSISNQIQNIEGQILDILQQHSELKKNFQLVTSVKGVGMIVAINMILCTQNFTSFPNPRKFNCYSGLAPFEHTSGISIRGKTRTSHWRNKTMKALLFNGAYAAVRSDHQLAKYYQRKIKEGKAKQSVINAVACKLVYRVFAVVKRGEPYVNLAY